MATEAEASRAASSIFQFPVYLPTTMSVLGWFHHLRVRNAALREAMLAEVHRQGVKLEPAESGEVEGAGLVLFDRIDAELCEALQRDSRGGFNRIIAVATTQEALGQGGAWRLLDAGAADAFAWDSMPEPGAAIADRFRRYAKVDSLLDSPAVRKELTGQSPVWISALRQIVEVAAFSDASVLITGESGTGKELVANQPCRSAPAGSPNDREHCVPSRAGGAVTTNQYPQIVGRAFFCPK